MDIYIYIYIYIYTYIYIYIYTDISLCACACVTAVVRADVFMHAAFSVASFPIPCHVSALVARQLADSLCMSPRRRHDSLVS